MQSRAKQVAKDILAHQLSCMGYWSESEMLDRRGCSEEEIEAEVEKLILSITKRYLKPRKKN